MAKKSNSLFLLKTADKFKKYRADDVIFRQGDEGHDMFVIKSGVVELRTDDLVIGTFETGDIFGEMSLVDQDKRSATATALTDCELVSIDNARFQSMILEAPNFAVEVMQIMSERLRHMNHETGFMYRRAESTRLQAMTDPLTGVGNRRAWDERLAAEESRCRRFGHSACIVSIDLDGLKQLNDSKGHARGDDLIRDAAHALVECCRDTDFVARLGGDEFGILAVECHLEAGRRLAEGIEERFKHKGIEASIGTAMRDEGGDLRLAWEQADKAMYEIKRARKDKK